MLRCADKGNKSHGEFFMSTKRRNHTPKFKFGVALKAAQNDKTINQIAGDHNIHTNLVTAWRKQLLGKGSSIFLTASARSAAIRRERERAEQEATLYEQIGRLKMENEWLKKKYAQFT